MQTYKTQEQIDADSKHFEEMALAERVSKQDSQEIARRHKQFKKRAKNLAGLKGADKSALLYERFLLKKRLNEIDNYLIKNNLVKCSKVNCWIDDNVSCSMGEMDIKDCCHYQHSF